jgi:hypothetical protein
MSKRKLEIEVDCEDSTCGGCHMADDFDERGSVTWCHAFGVDLGVTSDAARCPACLASEVPARTCLGCKHWRAGVCYLDGCSYEAGHGCGKWEARTVEVGTPLFRNGSTTPSSPTDRPVGLAERNVARCIRCGATVRTFVMSNIGPVCHRCDGAWKGEP